ncbi:putative membrane protein [Streptomyces davaonensis JCM 4913]|uniref:Putative membrane protein n=1 Tax=Streptomyces davaonensis (strain DSM 101723 / JCM 4913 / KCC S-0913 / 768) TaxID=1214101 RepID=K4R2Y1_STRDJ|nr:hypothetical protein [Streptomyces davaonensis]CCK27487.1 putative membrane protein [Streptomyces davaonensis JCM 4913]
MNDNQSVRELLGRAVDQVPVPADRGGAAVFARAALLRRRRRVAATGALAAVVAGGLVLGAGVLPEGGGESVAAAPTGGGTATGAEGFAALLPDGIGEVEEVSLVRLVKLAPEAELPEDVGPYDGDYAVERDGGVGYITVRGYTAEDVRRKGIVPDPCVLTGESPYMKNCETEKLPDGSRLSVWEDTGTLGDENGHPDWGPGVEASLRLEGGALLRLRDITGYLGKGSPGPLLKKYPITREQLRELALKPELRP